MLLAILLAPPSGGVLPAPGRKTGLPVLMKLLSGNVSDPERLREAAKFVSRRPSGVRTGENADSDGDSVA